MTQPLSPRPHVWIWYDGRAAYQDTDDCSVLEACTSRKDVRQSISTWEGHDAILFEYDFTSGSATNERKVGHVRQGYALMKDVSRAPSQSTSGLGKQE